MTELALFLNRVDTLAFVFLGVAASIDFARRGGRSRAWLAAAFGLLGVVSVLAQWERSSGPMPQFVGVITALAFLASGYALIELRHSITAFPRFVHGSIRMVIGAIAVYLTLALLAADPAQPLAPAQTVAVILLIVSWVGCATEPGIHFWLASRRLPTVQRRRLQALSFGYLGIAAVLLFALGLGGPQGFLPTASMAAFKVVQGLLTTAAIPFLFIAFAPPRWLRRAWRSSEEAAYNRATDDLVSFATEQSELGARALEWATRLVGAQAGVLLAPDGEIIAAQGLGAAESRDFAREAAARFASHRNRVTGSLLVVPVRASSGDAILAVRAGEFTPVFGSDEVSRLRQYASTLSIAMERVRLSLALHQQTARMESLLEAVSHLGEGLVITERGRLVYANDAYLKLVGYELEELLDKNLIDLAPAEIRQELGSRLAARLAGSDEPVTYEAQLVRKDGTVLEIETAIHKLESEGPSRLIALVRDITPRRQAEAAAAAAARLDPVTGVPNRRVWDEELARAMTWARRDHDPLCVVIMDLDHFKDFNDDWGHPRGDRLLHDVATAWAAGLRDVDVLARYGGDEFAIVMPGCTAQDATGVLQRLSSLTPERQQTSIGIAEWNGTETAEELVARADAALFQSKRDRRGQIIVAEGKVVGDEFTGWSNRITAILAKRQLTAAYQPIIDLAEGRVVGYEALARPTGSAADMSVEDLFTAAQRLGYTRDLDWLSRRAALAGAHALPRETLLFLNVSTWALLDPVHDVDQMLLLLRWSRWRPEEMVLEMSERDVITDLDRLQVVLRDYRHHGFRFALDDVGEGHSTLEVLAAADAEYIKIARSLTQQVNEPGPGSAVRAIATFAERSGAQLIAEGVSDAENKSQLRALGVRLGQGFAIGRPVFFGSATPMLDVVSAG